MIYETEEYTLESEYDSYTILSNLPMQLIQYNLRGQIEDPSISSINYFYTINQKLLLIRNEKGGDDEIVSSIDSARGELYEAIVSGIENKVGLYVDRNILQLDEMSEIAEALYTIVVLEYKDTMVRFFNNYIKKNKRSLLEQLDAYNKKNVTAITMKKLLKNKDDATIAANLNKLMKFIIDLQISTDDFINYIDNGRYEVSVIEHAINTYVIGGDLSIGMMEILSDNIDIFDVVYNDLLYKII